MSSKFSRVRDRRSAGPRKSLTAADRPVTELSYTEYGIWNTEWGKVVVAAGEAIPVKLDNVEQSPSLKEKAKQAIKKAILSRELQAGQYYGIEEIVKQLNVSKTPVREALQDLEARGFVTLSPRKGVLINKLTEKNISDFYAFRMVMECAVVEQIAKLVTEEDIGVLRKYTEQSKACIKKNDRLGVLKNDREAHLYLARMTDNSFLIPQLERIRDLVDWMILLRRERMTAAITEHDRLIDLLSRRDAKGARQAMKAHIQNSLKSALTSLKSGSS